jgi:hypothetical protein
MRGLGVTATPLIPSYCNPVQITFTTNGTKWYSLPTEGVGSYAITVSYLRHDYNFTMSLGVSIWTCQTLYLPSGDIVGVTSPAGPCDLSNASGITTTTSTVSPHQNSISVSGLGLCSDAASCGVYPAPMSEALVLFNATVPVSMVTLYINNTYAGIIYQNPATRTVACTTDSGSTCSVILGGQGYTSGTVTSNTTYLATCTLPANVTTCSATSTEGLNTLTVFADQYKGGVPSSLQPVVKGDTYVYTFVAVFQDGSAATATASTTAG